MPWSLADLEERLLIGSTLVEGSTLTEEEARQVLAGRTISGHPLRELRELLNYRAATAWLIDRLAESPYLSQDLVVEVHRKLMEGLSDEAGRFKSRQNFTLRPSGERYEYLHPGRVGEAMQQWVEEFNAEGASEAAQRAAKLYGQFQRIHPFEDGNGRVGRLLMAYWFHWKHQLMLRFVAADRLEHLRALEASDTDDEGPLAEFFASRVER